MRIWISSLFDLWRLKPVFPSQQIASVTRATLGLSSLLAQIFKELTAFSVGSAAV